MQMDEIDANTINEYGCTFDADSNGIDIILDIEYLFQTASETTDYTGITLEHF